MIIYEDGAAVVSLKEDGAAVGHLVIKPRESAPSLFEMPPEHAEHLWWIASYAATAVFEGLGAQGTNIICKEGDAVALHVLPRYADDGLDVLWEAQKADPADLEGVAKTLKEALWYVGKEREVKPKRDVAEDVQEPVKTDTSDTPPAENYKLKQLQRSP